MSAAVAVLVRGPTRFGECGGCTARRCGSRAAAAWPIAIPRQPALLMADGHEFRYARAGDLDRCVFATLAEERAQTALDCPA